MYMSLEILFHSLNLTGCWCWWSSPSTLLWWFRPNLPGSRLLPSWPWFNPCSWSCYCYFEVLEFSFFCSWTGRRLPVFAGAWEAQEQFKLWDSTIWSWSTGDFLEGRSCLGTAGVDPFPDRWEAIGHHLVMYSPEVQKYRELVIEH